MARRGSFGKLPRSAPDLTSTIVSLMHEYMAQVDQNYVDAWKNGGKVDGKPVTDASLIKHFKARRDDLDTDDPLWAEWDNRVTQYTFAIEDSKMQVKYDNGKASDGDMARFYSRWAAKTPDNTEFQRTLLSAAGKFRAASAAKGRAAADKAGRDKFAKDVVAFEGKVTKGLSVQDALVKFAIDSGISPNAKTLADIDVSGGGVSDLLDVLKDGAYNLDDNGNLLLPGMDKAAAELTTALKKAIPDFTWKNGLGLISGSLEAAGTAAAKGAKYNKDSKYGTQKWGDFFGGSKVSIRYTKTAVDNLGPKEDLRANLEQYHDAVEAAHGNPYLEDEALDAYLAANADVAKRVLSNTTGEYSDPIVIGITNEARNLLAIKNGDTEYKPRPDWVGDPSAKDNAGTDQRFTSVAATAAGRKLLQEGGWLHVEDSVDANGNLTMTYAVHSKDERQGTGAFLVPGAGITDADGVVHPVYATAEPVAVHVFDENNNPLGAPALKKDPKTGQPIPVRDPKTNEVVTEADGKTPVFEPDESPDSGIKVISVIGADGKGHYLYQTLADDNSPVYTLDPPVVPGVTAAIRMDNGKPVLDYRVDSTMVTPDGKTNATGTAATGAGATAATGTSYISKYDTSKLSGGRYGDQGAWNKFVQDATNEFYASRGEAPGTRDVHGGKITHKPLTDVDRALIEDAAATKFTQSTSGGYGRPGRVVGPTSIPKKTPEQLAADVVKAGGTPATAPPVTGPSAAGAAGQVAATPGWMPANLIDHTRADVNPVTGNLNTGSYQSVLAGTIAIDLNLITKDDPDRDKKLADINDRIANAPATLKADLDAATKQGDVFAQRNANAEFTRWQKDLPNITSALTTVTTGEDPGKLTSPNNPVNQFFAKVLDSVGFTVPKGPAGSPILAQGFVVGRTTDADKTSRTFAPGGHLRPDGTPVLTDQNSRALKLPDVGAALPFLQPLADFISAASVPKLTPGTNVQWQQPNMLTVSARAAEQIKSSTPAPTLRTPAPDAGRPAIPTPSLPRKEPEPPEPDKTPEPPATPKTPFTPTIQPDGYRGGWRPV